MSDFQLLYEPAAPESSDPLESMLLAEEEALDMIERLNLRPSARAKSSPLRELRAQFVKEVIA